MELALNLIWVCVAIVGIGLLCRSLSRPAACPDGPASNWRKVVAMSCALVILFFVISMTDDLHDQEIVIEENKSLRILSVTGAPSLFTPGRVIPVFYWLFSPVAHIAPASAAVRKPVEPSEVLFSATLRCDQLSGRAPPVWFA